MPPKNIAWSEGMHAQVRGNNEKLCSWNCAGHINVLFPSLGVSEDTRAGIEKKIDSAVQAEVSFP